MSKVLVAVPLIGLLFVVSSARQKLVPRFEDYPAPIYTGKRAPVNLRSASRARTFRTVLREEVREGVTSHAITLWCRSAAESIHNQRDCRRAQRSSVFSESVGRLE